MRWQITLLSYSETLLLRLADLVGDHVGSVVLPVWDAARHV
jgi:hypothetical protein